MENRKCKEPYGADLLMRYPKGDTVRLAGSVMLAEFGLLLYDDAGELLDIDGVFQEVMNDRARVVIKRIMPRPAPFAWIKGHSSRWVRNEEVLGVIEGEAKLWLDAARLKGVCDEREGIKTSPAPVMWTIGAQEMPASTTRWWWVGENLSR